MKNKRNKRKKIIKQDGNTTEMRNTTRHKRKASKTELQNFEINLRCVVAAGTSRRVRKYGQIYTRHFIYFRSDTLKHNIYSIISPTAFQ